ncbi:calnexin precursor [Obelidium mucronatum]|nr:calnexin precursor [Obelidium mucronatum]
MKFTQVLALTVGLLATHARATEAASEAVVADATTADAPVPEAEPVAPTKVIFLPTKRKAHFLDQFVPETVKRWIPSEAKKIVDGIEDEDLLRFRGRWNIEESVIYPGLKGDRGLTVKTAAAHHAISAAFASPFDTNGKTLVKLQKGLECGGAYMKLLTYNPAFTPAQFSDKTPYTIMFGPDRCGSTNKVHFIFRHQNPVSKEWEEKHLNSVVTAKIDKLTNVYTLVIRPDQSFEILINGESEKKGSLLKDMEPPVNPSKEIDDPSDKKPEDWVDNAKIPDPNAVKPADWDETAPREIIDEDATIPDDWLENEPKSVNDPEAVKPEDWDDEEDGEWSAPTVDNPKCAEVSGCGPWTKPLKPNPDYKGKWKAPIIDNPDYKGPWTPRKIANPHYFEDKTPSNMGKIGAIGFELWTMQDLIQFDNLWIGDSESEAKAFRAETWANKHKLELAEEEKAKPKDEEAAKNSGNSWFNQAVEKADQFRARIYKFVDRAVQKGDWFEATLDDPAALGTCVLMVLYLLNCVYSLVLMVVGLFSKKAPAGGDAKEKKE